MDTLRKQEIIVYALLWALFLLMAPMGFLLGSLTGEERESNSGRWLGYGSHSYRYSLSFWCIISC